MRTDIAPILAAHPGLWHRARFARLHFEIASSGERLRVRVDGQQVLAGAPRDDGDEACDFVLSAPAQAWDQFARTMPAPGFHDILAMIETGNARFSGDGLPFFRNLFVVKGIVSAVFRGEARW